MAPRPVYSKTFWADNLTDDSAESPVVPDGVVWDIRRINFSGEGSDDWGNEWRCFDSSGNTFAEASLGWALMGFQYVLDVELVIVAGDYWTVGVRGGPWYFTFSGFELTTP